MADVAALRAGLHGGHQAYEADKPLLMHDSSLFA